MNFYQKFFFLPATAFSFLLFAQQRKFQTHRDLENKIGKHFPIEHYINRKGENFNSKEIEGKMTLINFWSTTCEPCVKELPHLNELKNKMGNQANFIAITYDSKEKTDRFLTNHEFNFLHITDSGTELKSYFSVLRNPMTFIIDKNGNIMEITGIIDDTKMDDLVELLSR